MKKNLTLLTSAMFFIATLVSCNNDDDYNNGPNNGVTPPPTVDVTGVSLDQTEVAMYTNSSLQLTAIVLPEDATNRNVTWSSDNNLVAIVNNFGMITAVSEGEATITVATIEGNFRATAVVTVTRAPFIVDAQVEDGHLLNSIVRYVVAVTEANFAEVGRTTFANGGFTLTLPAGVNPSYLINIIDFLEDPSATVSDNNANVEMAFIDGLSASGNLVAEFFYAGIDIDMATFTITFMQALFIYADRNVTATSSFSVPGFSETLNLSLNAGWNRAYLIMRESAGNLEFILSSTPVIGVDMMWLFDDGSTSATTAGNDLLRRSIQEHAPQSNILRRSARFLNSDR